MQYVDPTPEKCAAFLLREASLNKSSIFDPSVSEQDMLECSCEHCHIDDKASWNYCCKALITFNRNLTANGSLLLRGLKKLACGGKTNCITGSTEFQMFLSDDIVAAAADMYDSVCDESAERDKNKRLRYASYRLLIFRAMGKLKSGQRVQLPSCIVNAVRAKWPSSEYKGYMDSFVECDS